jgi:hypothetical protein
MHWQTYFIEFSYLLASILFIFGLKGLSHPETAKRGMHLAELGMTLAIIGTLMHFEIVTYTWIIVGTVDWRITGRCHGRVGADDCDAATNCVVARVWRIRRGAGRHRGVLQLYARL